MGQAKQRGSYEDRVAKAKERIEGLRPEKIVCNNCQTAFTDFDVMNSNGLPGNVVVFGGVCPQCNRSTFALAGDPDAVADVALQMEEAMGEQFDIGAQSKSGKLIG